MESEEGRVSTVQFTRSVDVAILAWFLIINQKHTLIINNNNKLKDIPRDVQFEGGNVIDLLITSPVKIIIIKILKTKRNLYNIMEILSSIISYHHLFTYDYGMQNKEEKRQGGMGVWDHCLPSADW